MYITLLLYFLIYIFQGLEAGDSWQPCALSRPPPPPPEGRQPFTDAALEAAGPRIRPGSGGVPGTGPDPGICPDPGPGSNESPDPGPGIRSPKPVYIIYGLMN